MAGRMQGERSGCADREAIAVVEQPVELAAVARNSVRR